MRSNFVALMALLLTSGLLSACIIDPGGMVIGTITTMRTDTEGFHRQDDDRPQGLPTAPRTLVRPDRCIEAGLTCRCRMMTALCVRRSVVHLAIFCFLHR